MNFDDGRQQRARHSLKVSRFKTHYGVEPDTAAAVFKDLKKDYPKIKLLYYMLTLNWLKLYDYEHVLCGRWVRSEDTIRVKVKEYAKYMQSLKPKKIVFDGWHDDEIISSLLMVSISWCKNLGKIQVQSGMISNKKFWTHL